jgi:hypothetical protein
LINAFKSNNTGYARKSTAGLAIAIQNLEASSGQFWTNSKTYLGKGNWHFKGGFYTGYRYLLVKGGSIDDLDPSTCQLSGWTNTKFDNFEVQQRGISLLGKRQPLSYYQFLRKNHIALAFRLPYCKCCTSFTFLPLKCLNETLLFCQS